MPNEPAPLRVVMVVANHVYADTRVKKMAVTLAGAGLDVAVVGMSESKHRSETRLGKARIIRVPVAFTIRDAARRAYGRRSVLHPAAPLPKQEYVAELQRMKARERELVSDIAFNRSRRGGRGMAAALRAPGATLRILGDKARLARLQKRERPRLKQRQTRDVVEMPKTPARPARSRTKWRRHLPEIADLELAFGPVIDELEPDILHAHDVFVLGIAANAVARRRARGAECALIYDAHEYIAGLAYPTPSLRGVGKPSEALGAYLDLEQQYLSRADEVITVSEPLADLLVRDYGLDRRPAVVMNIPLSITTENVGAPSVRECAGVPEGDPLLVYVGGMHATRGVETLVDALQHLPDNVHVAVGTRSGRIGVLLDQADRGGTRSRLHIVPFVEPDQVSTYLSSATIGIHPLVGVHMNRRVAMPNKFFEYFHAGLPIVVSSDTAMADEVRAHGLGEPFEPGDSRDLARAVQHVLDNLETFRARIRSDAELARRFSWPAQAEVLADVYRRLAPAIQVAVSVTQPSIAEQRPEATESSPKRGPRPSGLLIGPFNMAGQPHVWMRAVRAAHPQIHTEVMARESAGVLNFDCDRRVTDSMWRSFDWQVNFFRHVLSTHTHVLSETATSLFSDLFGRRPRLEEEMFAARGIRLGHVFHGSEIRDPTLHVELVRSSPFRDDEDLRHAHQAKVAATLARLADSEAPAFVTTVDLLDYLPDATWLPVVPRELAQEGLAGRLALDHDQPPVFLHLPSSRRLKGSTQVDRVLGEFADAGLIEYLAPGRISPDDVTALMARADVVIDSLSLGAYGLLSCEAMQLGRLVICNVERTVERLPEPPPLLHADPDTLQAAVQRVLDDRSSCAALAQEGPRYVSSCHSEAVVVRTLAPFLDLEPSAAPRLATTASA